MPQDTFLPTDPRITGLRLTVHEIPAEGGYAWGVTIEEQWSPGGWRTCSADRWTGLMVDLLPTLGEEVLSAFMFGDQGQVARAAAMVRRTARAHLRRHGG